MWCIRHHCYFALVVFKYIYILKSLIQLPNGVTQSHAMYQDRFGKLQEHLRQLALLFRKLRLLYERCVEMTSDLQEEPAEVRREACSSVVRGGALWWPWLRRFCSSCRTWGRTWFLFGWSPAVPLSARRDRKSWRWVCCCAKLYWH